MEKEQINWKEEKENLKENNEWFKPEAGIHKIVFLSNGEKNDKTFEGKPVTRCMFDIETNNKRLSWELTAGTTQNSLYGQIVLIANANNNSLLGVPITLMVKGSGKEKNYTISEAVQLMEKKEKD